VLTLLLESLPAVIALPVAFVVLALLASLFGKLKRWFDKRLTPQNLVLYGPHIATFTAFTHAALCVVTAAWGYWGTDMFPLLCLPI